MANTLRFKRGLASGIPTAVAGEPLFTTDTFDLYIGNGTTNTRFQKYIASGTTSQLLRGDGSLLTMPIVLTSPATGQVLKYNGTSWVNDSDAGITGSGSAGQVAYFTGATTQGGSNNLFWNNSSVRLGIGLVAPTTTLHTRGASSDIMSNIVTFDKYDSAGTDLHQLIIGIDSVTNYVNFYSTGNNNGGFIFTRGGTEMARFFPTTGNFGINTGATDSGERLQVTGTMKTTSASGAAPDVTFTNTAGGSWLRMIGAGTPTNIIDSNGTLIVRNGSTYTTKLTLDTSGNLGLGVTPSAWGSNYKVYDASYTTLANEGTSFGQAILANNAYNDGTSASPTWKFKNAASANMYIQDANNTARHSWFTSTASGSAGGAITFTRAMTLYSTGNLVVGATSDSGERLQVTGTMKVTGASSFVGDNNQIAINTTGTFSSLYFNVNGNSRGAFYVTDTQAKVEGRGTGGLILGGATSQTHLTIASTGAATFSSTVTGGSFIPTSATAPTNGMYLATTNTLAFSTGSSERMRIDSGGNIAIGITTASGKLHAQQPITTISSTTLGNNTAVGLNITYPDTSLAGGEGIAMALGMNGRGRSYLANIHISTSKDASELAFFNTQGAVITERMRIRTEGQVRFVPLAAAPSNTQAGDVYYDSTTNKLRCYNGTTWNDLF